MNWNLDSIATVIGIVSGVFSIFQILKEFLSKDNVAIKQTNVNGDNIYIDNRSNTTITESHTHTTKTTYTSRSSDDDIGEIVLYAILGLGVLILSLALYSQTYKILPLICMILFTYSIWKEMSIPFASMSAKVFWLIKKLLILALIGTLFIMPNSIMEIINLIPNLNIESWSAVQEWFSKVVDVTFSLWNGDRLIMANIFFKIFGSLGLALFLFFQCRASFSIHREPKLSSVFLLILGFLFTLIILNIETFWGIIEPLRKGISKWTSS